VGKLNSIEPHLRRDHGDEFIGIPLPSRVTCQGFWTFITWLII